MQRKDFYQLFEAWKKPGVSDPARVFNEFPSLLTSEQSQDFFKKLKKIFEEIKPTLSMIIMDVEERAKIEAWVAGIAKLACSVLLDGYGNLKWNFTKLLGWETISYPLLLSHTERVICSFVATANEQFSIKIRDFVEWSEFKNAAIFKLINESYLNIVRRVIATTQKKGCYEEAIQLSDWLIRKEEVSAENIAVFARIMRADFSIIREEISRPVKLSFWLNVMDACLPYENKKGLFLAAWKVFSENFDVVKEQGILFERQLSQYKRCHTAQLKKMLKNFIVTNGTVEMKEESSIELSQMVGDRLWKRDHEWVSDLDKERYKNVLLKPLVKAIKLPVLEEPKPETKESIAEKKEIVSDELKEEKKPTIISSGLFSKSASIKQVFEPDEIAVIVCDLSTVTLSEFADQDVVICDNPVKIFKNYFS